MDHQEKYLVIFELTIKCKDNKHNDLNLEDQSLN